MIFRYRFVSSSVSIVLFTSLDALPYIYLYFRITDQESWSRGVVQEGVRRTYIGWRDYDIMWRYWRRWDISYFGCNSSLGKPFWKSPVYLLFPSPTDFVRYLFWIISHGIYELLGSHFGGTLSFFSLFSFSLSFAHLDSSLKGFGRVYVGITRTQQGSCWWFWHDFCYDTTMAIGRGASHARSTVQHFWRGRTCGVVFGDAGYKGLYEISWFIFSPSCCVCILSFPSSLLFFYLISTSSALSSLPVLALYFSYSPFL